VAQTAREIDEGVPFEDPAPRLIEENMWRAIRFGQDGSLIDLATATEYPAASATDRLLEWTAPMRAELGIDPAFPELNGARRQRRRIDAGASREEIYAETVREARETYTASADQEVKA
jgi:carboxylate-amine ligase